MPLSKAAKRRRAAARCCRRKERMSERRARAAASDGSRRNGIVLEAYHCSCCDGWHVGKPGGWAGGQEK